MTTLNGVRLPDHYNGIGMHDTPGCYAACMGYTEAKAHALDLVNTEAGSRVDEYSQLANGLQNHIDRLQLQYRRLYGWTAGTLESGYAYLDFAAHGDE